MKDIIYVLITAARNEQQYIEKTIQSVVSQTILPNKWVIVSDGSTDRTDEIVKRYEGYYDFIQLFRREPGDNRNFASQVYAQKTGISQLEGIEYQFLGLLDADVSFERDYYESVLGKFQENAKLGIAGGILFENIGGKWVRLDNSTSWSVGGPIQMFRRECYEAIDYIPLKRGGQDAIAEVMARMHGWEVRSFPGIVVLHHRITGTETRNILSVRFQRGVAHHCNGNHPFFEVVRCLYRIFERPYVLGSLFTLCGYLWSCISGDEIMVPKDVVKYLRKEQVRRIVRLVWRRRNMP
jgi:glycosyltransferase involved in cell wall biosynthesis